MRNLFKEIQEGFDALAEMRKGGHPPPQEPPWFKAHIKGLHVRLEVPYEKSNVNPLDRKKQALCLTPLFLSPATHTCEAQSSTLHRNQKL